MADLQALLAENVRFYRNLLGITQAELASKADISTKFISSIEQGKRWPSPENFNQLADALKILPSKLLDQSRKLGTPEEPVVKENLLAFKNKILSQIEETGKAFGL